MEERIRRALNVAVQYGQTDGDHHKAWVIDQMVRELTGCPAVMITNHAGANGPFEYEALGESDEYLRFVRDACAGEDGPSTYGWWEGIAP